MQGGLIQPIAGFMVDRVGSRVMALSGVLMIGVGFLLFSQITELWQFYAALIVISTGMSVGVGTAFNAALVNWFRRNRSKVLAIVWSGTPAAGALVLGLGLIIDRYGWDTAALLVGVVMLVVGLPLCLLIRHRPEPYGLHPDGDLPAAAVGAPAPHSGTIGLSVAEALHSKAFWVLSLGMAVELMAVQAILIHQVEHLEESGWTFKEATFVASSMVFGLVLGRSPYAFIGDRVDKRLQLSVVLVLVGLGVVALEYVTSLWTAALYVVLIGFGHGALVPLRVTSIADWMGTARFASIMGLVEFPAIMGGLVGPLLLGVIFDRTGDYRIGLFVFGGLLLLTAPVFALLPKPRFSGRT